MNDIILTEKNKVTVDAINLPCYIPKQGSSFCDDTEEKVTTSADFAIIWRNLGYSVELRKWNRLLQSKRSKSSTSSNHVNENEKIIFDGISGEAKSRQLTAIMGPSGAGKSSLLHCLFRNKTKGVSGQVLVEQSGEIRKRKLKVCFIPQHDYLNEWLTVREDLTFVSKLKFTHEKQMLDMCFFSNHLSHESDEDQLKSAKSYAKCTKYSSKTSLIDHETNVLRMADLLSLNNCLDVPIKKISGGERKRLSIARELMSKPDILVLDEPTTGLDSLTCHKTITVLRDLVKRSSDPMAVVVTIHQPEKSVFNLFDQTYFLSKGEGVVFDDNPRNAVDVIEKVTHLKLPSKNYNPASYLIEIACDKPYELERSLLNEYQRLKFNQKYSNAKVLDLLRDAGMKSLRTNSKQTTTTTTTTTTRSDQPNLTGATTATNTVTSTTNVGKNLKNLETSLLMESGSDVRSSLLVDHQGSYSFDQDTYFICNELKDCANNHSNRLADSFRHVFILTHRSWLSIIRNPSLTKSRLAIHTVLPLLMLAVFGSKMGKKDACPKLIEGFDVDQMRKDLSSGSVYKNIDDYRFTTENICFFFLLFYGFAINIISLASSFYPLTLNMYKKETGNGLYSIGPSFIAQILAELPLEIFFPTFSTLLGYLLTGQTSSYMEWRMFVVGFIVFIGCYFVQTIGLISGLVFSGNVSNAVIVAQLSLLPFVVTSGFVVRLSRMPELIRILSEGSLFKHILTGLIAARFGFNLCDCDEDKLPDSDNTMMKPQQKKVLDYMFPSNENSTLGPGVHVSDLFERMNDDFIKAQTFGLKIETCQDVRPFVMETFSVQDSDLYVSLVYCITGTILLKVLLYFLLKTIQYRKT